MKKEYSGKKSSRTTGAKNVSRSGSRPGTGRSSSGRPGSGRPSSGRPSSGRPSSGRPSLGRPVRRSEESSGYGEDTSFRRESRPSSGRPGSGRPSSSRPSSGRPSLGRPSSGRPSLGRPVRRSEESSGYGEDTSFRRESRPSSGRPGAGRPGSGRPSSSRPSSGRPSSGRPVRRSEESSGYGEDTSFRRESRPSSGRPSSGRPSSGRPGSGAPRRDTGKPLVVRPVRRSEESFDDEHEAPTRRPSAGRPSSGAPRRDTGKPLVVRPVRRSEESFDDEHETPTRRPSAGRPGSGAPRRDTGKPLVVRPVRRSEESFDNEHEAPVRRPSAGRPGSGAPRRDTGKPLAVRPVRRSEESFDDESEAPVRRPRNGGRAIGTARRDSEQQDGMRPVRRRPESGTAGKQREERNLRQDEQPERVEKRSAGRTKAKPRGSAPQIEVDEGGEVRLNKFLADAGIASRRKSDELIQQGVVKVNQEVVTEPGTKVHPSDLVTVRGEPVSSEKHLTYILLNKPKGYITTTSDEKGRKTVMDIVRSRERIFPVGRLDRNTSGVLLFTNDGEMANHLMHPRYEVPRVYNVTLNKYLLMEDARKIAAGVELEDGKTQPCSIIIDPEKKNKVTLEITEGKNREVRRIFESLGYDVEKLDRKIYAGLTTRGMKRGEFRHLTRQEVRELEELLSLQHRSTSTSQAGSGRRRTPGRGRKKSW